MYDIVGMYVCMYVCVLCISRIQVYVCMCVYVQVLAYIFVYVYDNIYLSSACSEQTHT